MLYFLLIIIAIGVLLISQVGQELLGWIIKLLFMGGKLLLGLLLVALVIYFFTTGIGEQLASTVLGILGIFVAVSVLIGIVSGVGYLLKKAGLSEKTIGIIGISILVLIIISPVFVYIYAINQ